MEWTLSFKLWVQTISPPSIIAAIGYILRATVLCSNLRGSYMRKPEIIKIPYRNDARGIPVIGTLRLPIPQNKYICFIFEAKFYHIFVPGNLSSGDPVPRMAGLGFLGPKLATAIVYLHKLLNDCFSNSHYLGSGAFYLPAAVFSPRCEVVNECPTLLQINWFLIDCLTEMVHVWFQCNHEWRTKHEVVCSPASVTKPFSGHPGCLALSDVCMN